MKDGDQAAKPGVEASQSEVHAVRSQQTIPFWPQRPDLWFLTLENSFRLQRNLDDDTKYAHVVAALPQDAILTIADILQNPPPAGQKYESVKTALINRYTVSAEKRLNDVLSGFHDMGDLSPSKFFRLLEQKAGDTTLVSENLLKTLWLKRLPERLRLAVAGWADKPIQEILQIADQIWDYGQPSTSHVASMQRPSTSKATGADDTALADLQRQVQNLTRLVSQLSVNRVRSPGRTHFSNRSRSRSPSNSGLCYYHRRFGKHARQCTQPCRWRSGVSNVTSKNKNSTSEN